jgi:hypothetical protein
MKGLRGRDEVHGVRWECCSFGRPVYACETRILCEQFFRSSPHFLVGFNAKNRIAVLEK